MRLTQAAERPPRSCAKSGRADGPFVDFHVQIDPLPQAPFNLYLHKGIVEEAGKLVGMVPAAEVEALRAELKGVAEEFEAVRDLLATAAELEQALGNVKERADGRSIADVLSDLKERIG